MKVHNILLLSWIFGFANGLDLLNGLLSTKVTTNSRQKQYSKPFSNRKDKWNTYPGKEIDFVRKDEFDSDEKEEGKVQTDDRDLSQNDDSHLDQKEEMNSDFLETRENEDGKPIAVMKGYILVGDILMPKEFSNGSKSQVSYKLNTWKNGLVPYVVDPSAYLLMPMVDAAFKNIQSTTCITFVPRKKETNYIKILWGPSCYSNVGTIKNGPQPFSLSAPCNFHGWIVHQLGHVIGLFHEHNRPDRDNHVAIYKENIAKGMQNVFFKLEENDNQTTSEYDPFSIMQYSETAYSKDGWLKTMTSRKGIPLMDPFSKPGLSVNDIAKINGLYDC